MIHQVQNHQALIRNLVEHSQLFQRYPREETQPLPVRFVLDALARQQASGEQFNEQGSEKDYPSTLTETILTTLLHGGAMQHTSTRTLSHGESTLAITPPTFYPNNRDGSQSQAVATIFHGLSNTDQQNLLNPLFPFPLKRSQHELESSTPFVTVTDVLYFFDLFHKNEPLVLYDKKTGITTDSLFMIDVYHGITMLYNEWYGTHHPPVLQKDRITPDMVLLAVATPGVGKYQLKK